MYGSYRIEVMLVYGFLRENEKSGAWLSKESECWSAVVASIDALMAMIFLGHVKNQIDDTSRIAIFVVIPAIRNIE